MYSLFSRGHLINGWATSPFRSDDRQKNIVRLTHIQSPRPFMSRNMSVRRRTGVCATSNISNICIRTTVRTSDKYASDKNAGCWMSYRQKCRKCRTDKNVGCRKCRMSYGHKCRKCRRCRRCWMSDVVRTPTQCRTDISDSWKVSGIVRGLVVQYCFVNRRIGKGWSPICWVNAHGKINCTLIKTQL